MGQFNTTKWGSERIKKQKAMLVSIANHWDNTASVYSAVLSEMERLHDITNIPAITDWARSLAQIFTDASNLAIKDQSTPFMNKSNPFDLRISKVTEVLYKALKEFIEFDFAKWRPECLEELRQDLRENNAAAVESMLMVTNTFSALNEIERLQKMITQSDLKFFVDSLMRTYRHTLAKRFDECPDYVPTEEETRQTEMEIESDVKFRMASYIQQTVWHDLGVEKTKWTVTGRHKNAVPGFTITEIHANAHAYGPDGESLPLVRFIAKSDDIWKYLVYEGVYYPGVAREVNRRVGNIQTRIIKRDNCVYPEYSKVFNELAEQA